MTEYNVNIMKKYILKRILQLIPILLCVTFLTFALMRLAGGDAVSAVYERTGTVVSDQVMENRRAQLGLDQPFLVQYARWLWGLLRGNMGVSYVSGKDVFQTFMSKLPATMLLTLTSMLLTMVISLPLGILAAVKQNRIPDKIIRILSLIGNSMPGFLVALLLMYLLAIHLRIFPTMSTGVNLQSIVLPTLTLSVSMSAKYIRQVRAVVLDELGKPYVTGARARGVRQRVILWKNVLRVSISALITLTALSVGSLLGGSAIVENIFMWDGVGKLAVDSINMRDYPMILAYVVWMAVIYTLVNLAADILYQAADPRVRGQSESGRKRLKKLPAIEADGSGSVFIRKPLTGFLTPVTDHISARKRKIRKRHTKQKLVITGVLVAALLLTALFARQLCPYDPNAQNLQEAFQAPTVPVRTVLNGTPHLFGTDQFGRDMLSRVIMGSRVSIFSALALVLVILIVGTVVGVAAGYNGGIADAVLMRISDIFLSFPSLVFALAVAGVLGGGTQNAILALALIGWPKYARLVRGQVLSQKENTYIDAARLAGDSNMKIILHHILPNIMGPVLVTAVLDIGTMMMELAGLSFLGLGAMPPTPEWGSMMSDARGLLQTVPWVTLSPGLGIFVTVVIFNTFGDVLRDWLDPAMRE